MSTQLDPPKRPATPWLALSILLLATGLWHLHILDRWMERRSDLLPPWIATRVALAHGNPYAPSTTREIQLRYYGYEIPPGSPGDRQAFAYPLYTVFFLAPLAWLPWQLARVVFVATAILALAAATVAWLRIFGARISRAQTVLYVLAALVGWPTLVALRQQQLTLLALIFLSAGCFALFSRRPTLAGLLLSCALIKPQIAAPLLLWILIRSLIQRQWRLPAAFIAGLALLFLGGLWLRPTWPGEWRAAVAAYHRYTGGEPSLCIYLGILLGGLVLAAVTLLSLAALWRNARSNPHQIGLAAALLLALTCALLPTGIQWVYNQTLLLPGCLFLAAMQPAAGRPEALTASRTRVAALVCLAISFLLPIVSVLGETLTSPSGAWDFLPYANLFLPSFVAVALATCALTQPLGGQRR